MKEIQPFIIWVNGVNKTAIYMALICNNDNLINQAVFYWAFYDQIDGKAGNVIANGTITMTQPDYDSWTSNEYAWSWAAGQLGVTLVSTEEPAPVVTKKKK